MNKNSAVDISINGIHFNTDMVDKIVCWKCDGTGNKKIKPKMAAKKCAVCKGIGHIESLKRKNGALQEGYITDTRRPTDWVAPGPKAAKIGSPKKGEALCCLIGDWRIFQRIGGHRFSTDDVVTAWLTGATCRRLNIKPRNHLDIGCGLASVLMMVAWQFEDIPTIGIEAQVLSVGLARRSLKYNGIDHRVEVVHGDMRDLNVLSKEKKGTFDIVTGTPPYFKFGTAAEPSKIDQTACLFEYRGGIEAYCKSAAYYLTPETGLFFVVDTSLAIDRVEKAAESTNLEILERFDCYPKFDKPSLISVFVMKLRMNELKSKHSTSGDASGSSNTTNSGNSATISTAEKHKEEKQHGQEEVISKQSENETIKDTSKINNSCHYLVNSITIRDRNGDHTDEYNKLLVEIGFPPNYSKLKRQKVKK